MAIRHIWESKARIGTKDFARVSYDDATGLYAILTTDNCKPKVIVVDQHEMRDLAKKLSEFIDEIDCEEIYERSEKDAMWESD